MLLLHDQLLAQQQPGKTSAGTARATMRRGGYCAGPLGQSIGSARATSRRHQTNFSDLNRHHDRYERAPTRGRPKVTGSWGNRWQTRRLNSLNSLCQPEPTGSTTQTTTGARTEPRNAPSVTMSTLAHSALAPTGRLLRASKLGITGIALLKQIAGPHTGSGYSKSGFCTSARGSRCVVEVS